MLIMLTLTGLGADCANSDRSGCCVLTLTGLGADCAISDRSGY